MLTILVEDRRASAVPGDLNKPTNTWPVALTKEESENIAAIDSGDRPAEDISSRSSQVEPKQTGDDPPMLAATKATALERTSFERLSVDAEPPNMSDGCQNPAEAVTQLEQQYLADVLHVGCGAYSRDKLPPVFREKGWREIRLDIDPAVNPDIVASITNMEIVSDGAIDAIYSSHNIEHLYPHEVPLALREMHRVLKAAGFAFIRLPDLQEVARQIADGNLTQPLYTSPMGAISPLDILYGHGASLAAGNVYMSHRTGFTGGTLGSALIKAGFAAAMVQRDTPTFSLAAVAFRTKPHMEQLTRTQALMLPNPCLPAVLYTTGD